jgi:LPS O-antigen subunit length determinant protein (WzzB/FepE family)
MSEQTPTDTPKQPGRLVGLRTRLGILGELFAFLWAAKMWWLIPMVVALIIFALVIALGAASGGSPLIYTLF